MNDHVVLTASHWVYLAVIVMILIFIVFRREVVVPSLIGIFILGILAAQRQGVVDSFIKNRRENSHFKTREGQSPAVSGR